MATGDVDDFVARLRRYLPTGWFPDTGPVLDGVLGGYATAAQFLHGLVGYARAQTRIATASDGFLDLAAADFLGNGLPRPAGQGDAAYRARILPEILRPRASRPAMVRVLSDLTGRSPAIVEPDRSGDGGAYDRGGAGYDMAGCWTDAALRSQSFVTAYRPVGAGIANVAGLDSGAGGYDAGGLDYTDAGMVAGGVTDVEIYAAVDATRAAGTLVWVQIKS